MATHRTPRLSSLSNPQPSSVLKTHGPQHPLGHRATFNNTPQVNIYQPATTIGPPQSPIKTTSTTRLDSVAIDTTSHLSDDGQAHSGPRKVQRNTTGWNPTDVDAPSRVTNKPEPPNTAIDGHDRPASNNIQKRKQMHTYHDRLGQQLHSFDPSDL